MSAMTTHWIHKFISLVVGGLAMTNFYCNCILISISFYNELILPILQVTAVWLDQTDILVHPDPTAAWDIRGPRVNRAKMDYLDCLVYRLAASLLKQINFEFDKQQQQKKCNFECT